MLIFYYFDFSSLFEFIIPKVSILIPGIATLIPHIFLHFHPDSSHSHFIPCILTLILRISLISFSNSPSKIEHSPLLLLHNFRHEIIIYIIYDVISVISKIYLPYFYNLWSRIKSFEWLKCYLFLSQREAKPAQNNQFFRNLSQFRKNFVTNFVPSQFLWLVDFSFNDMKYIFIQIFVQVDPYVDYTVELEYK